MQDSPVPRRGHVRLLLGAACAVALAITGTAPAGPAHADTTITTNQTGQSPGGVLRAAAADCSAGYVGLTFDDGPNAGTSNQLINALRQAGATGTVFPTGSRAQSNPSLMQAYRNAGLQIG